MGIWGTDNWWVDNGVWEVGNPSTGPKSSYDGENCAATVLNNDYPVGSSSRIISPSIKLTPQHGQSSGLYFWHWFSLSSTSFGHDVGNVQISVNGGNWKSISNNYSGSSSIWSQAFIDLSEYSDSTIRIAFAIIDETFYTGTSSGWYIDDVRLEGIESVPVELISFKLNSNDGNLKLDWSTATETNNKGFEIERSADNSSFTKISFIEGSGTSTETHEYSYTDKPFNPGKYYYRLKQIDFDGSFMYSKVIEVEYGIPLKYNLSQNYPNPFNPTTKISYSIPKAGHVSLKVFDILGKEVATLVNEQKQVGIYEVIFNGSNYPSGIYFYKIKSGSFTQIKKIILLK